MPGEQGRTKTLRVTRRPDAIPSLRFVDELGAWHRNDEMPVLGTGVTFSDIMETETAVPTLALGPGCAYCRFGRKSGTWEPSGTTP